MYPCEIPAPDLSLTEQQRATIRAALEAVWPTISDRSTYGLVMAYNEGKDMADRINGYTADMVWPPDERPGLLL